MTSFTPPSLYEYYSLQQEPLIDSPHHYYLKWRQGKLLVECSQQPNQPLLPPLNNQQWLVDCLTHSSTQWIGLDPALGEASLNFWANAGQQASKTLFLRVPSSPNLPQKQRPLSWWLKRSIEWIVTMLLLLVLSPLMLGLATVMHFYSSEPIFMRQWRVGERGKLFQTLKFRTLNPEAKSSRLQTEAAPIIQLKHWMQRYKLDELPQLLQVLQGEMSLVGPRSLSLREAVKLSPEERQRLNALPGLTGFWRWERRSLRLSVKEANQRDLESLYTWSLQKDLQALLLAVPRAFLSINS